MKTTVRQWIALLGITILMQSPALSDQAVPGPTQTAPSPAKPVAAPAGKPATPQAPPAVQKPAVAKPAVAKPEASKPASRIDEVIALVKGGFSDETVINSIRQANKPMNLTAMEMLKLKQAGVSEQVINALIDPSRLVSAPKTPAPTNATPPAGTTTGGGTSPDPVPPTVPQGSLQSINSDLSALNCTPAPRQRVIAITEFDYGAVKTQVQAIFGTQVDIGKGIMAILTKQLQQEGKYRIVERANMQVLFNEQNMGSGNRVKQGSNARVGKVLGADAYLMGTIVTFGRDDKKKGISAAAIPGAGRMLGAIRLGNKTDKAVVTIAYKLVDAETTEVIDTASESGESKRESKDFALLGAGGGGAGGVGMDMTSSNFAETIIGEATIACIRNLSARMNAQQAKVRLRNLDVEGRVAQIRDNQIYISVGSDDGVLKCDRFEVARIVKEVKDPVTKEVIDLDVEKIGEMVITDARNRMAIGQFQGTQMPAENMIVRKILPPELPVANPPVATPTDPGASSNPPPASQTLVPAKKK